MQLCLFAFTLAWGALLIAGTPQWDRIMPSVGQLRYICSTETLIDQETRTNRTVARWGRTLDRKVEIVYGKKVCRGARKNKETGRGEVWVEHTFPEDGVPPEFYKYAILADGQTYVEYARVMDGPVKPFEVVRWTYKKAQQKMALAYKNKDAQKALDRFEAVQRLVTPPGLLQSILELVFDPTGYTHFTERKESWDADEQFKVRSYTFNVTNDSEKHYTDKQLAKLYTTWQSVLGKEHAFEPSAQHVLPFLTPVKSVFAEVWENENKQMWLHKLYMYSTDAHAQKRAPAYTDDVLDTVIEFRNDKVYAITE